MEAVDVDCVFGPAGNVQVKRIAIGGKWQVIEQGRQWRDEAGLHVMILLHGNEPRELLLLRDRLSWRLQGGGTPGVYVV